MSMLTAGGAHPTAKGVRRQPCLAQNYWEVQCSREAKSNKCSGMVFLSAGTTTGISHPHMTAADAFQVLCVADATSSCLYDYLRGFSTHLETAQQEK
jgi:phosphoserine aminotransferase